MHFCVMWMHLWNAFLRDNYLHTYEYVHTQYDYVHMHTCRYEQTQTTDFVDTHIWLCTYATCNKWAYFHTMLIASFQAHCNTHCNAHCNTHCNAHCQTHRNAQCKTHCKAQCNTLQHTATHCNTLQHTATHCNPCIPVLCLWWVFNANCNAHRNAQCNAHFNAQCNAHFHVHCNTLQHTATHCNTFISMLCL